MVSPIVRDVLETFHNAYESDAEYIVSSMFANAGVYSLVYRMAELNTYNSYKHAFSKILNSYVWSELGVVSDVLQKSFLYTSINNAGGMICIMEDKALSAQLKAFKTCLVVLFQKHAAFLSYCDMEEAGLFIFCNGDQSMPIEQYELQRKQIEKEFDGLFKRYSRIVPRCVMDLLDTMMYWISVRKRKDKQMIEPCDIFKMFPCCPRYEEYSFHAALADLVYCKIDTLPTTIAKLYKHAIPFYVLNELQWLITMHGERREDQPLLKGFYSNEAMDGLITLKTFVDSESNSLVPIIKDLFTTPFWKEVFYTVENKHLLEEYTPAFMGGITVDILKQVQYTYAKNNRLLVLSDMLGCGVFDALSKKYQLRPIIIEPLVIHCEETLHSLQNHFTQYNELLNIIYHAMQPLKDALKRVRRYWMYCIKLFDMEETQNYLDLIFGDVFDGDGTPTTCAICLDTSQDKRETWFPLPCKHVFHTQCLEDMCAFSDRCPCCRCEI